MNTYTSISGTGIGTLTTNTVLHYVYAIGYMRHTQLFDTTSRKRETNEKKGQLSNSDHVRTHSFCFSLFSYNLAERKKERRSSHTAYTEGEETQFRGSRPFRRSFKEQSRLLWKEEARKKDFGCNNSSRKVLQDNVFNVARCAATEVYAGYQGVCSSLAPSR